MLSKIQCLTCTGCWTTVDLDQKRWKCTFWCMIIFILMKEKHEKEPRYWQHPQMLSFKLLFLSLILAYNACSRTNASVWIKFKILLRISECGIFNVKTLNKKTNNNKNKKQYLKTFYQRKYFQNTNSRCKISLSHVLPCKLLTHFAQMFPYVSILPSILQKRYLGTKSLSKFKIDLTEILYLSISQLSIIYRSMSVN